jgi:hypothetical protein
MMRKFFIALGFTLLAGAGLAVSQPFGPSGLLPTITDGATSIANAIKLTFSGCTVGGSSSNATVTCSGSGTGTVTNPANLTTHGPLVGGANGTTDAKAIAAMTNGQIPIGSTGADPVPGTITMGAGLNGATGAGTFTITPAGRTAVADANCATLTNANSLLAFTTVLTAARSCTLPAASTMLAGQRLCFVDEGDGTNPAINGANIVTLNRAGSDKIAGATSIAMSIGYSAICLEAEGSARWGVVGNMNLGSQTAPSNEYFNSLSSAGVLGSAKPLGTVNGIVKANGSGAPSLATAADVPATTLAAGTSVSLTAPREYYVCTGTCTVTPPVPAAGYEFCVMNDDNVATVITLAALGSSSRYEATARTSYGTAGTGTFVSGGAAGDKVCLLGRDSTHYLTVSFNGTWTAN